MKKKPAKRTPRKTKTYLVAVRITDEHFKTPTTEIFEFRSKVNREKFCRLLQQKDVEYATSEC